MSSQTGGTGSGASTRQPDAVAQAGEVQQPAAGDVREPVDRHVAAQQLERRSHVDHGRLEQRVGDGRAAQLGWGGIEAERLEHAPRASV